MSKILLVDDDEAFSEMLHLKLQRLGHEVIAAPDGLYVSKLLTEHQVDLVITDIIMPNKEGLEVILDLRKSNPEITVIAMSGGGRVVKTDFLEEAKRFGAICTLKKPFTDEELTAALDLALNK